MRNAVLAVILCGIGALSGCSAPQLYRDAANAGWRNYDVHHKPVVKDEVWLAMPKDQQALYMTETEAATVQFERDAATRLLKE